MLTEKTELCGGVDREIKHNGKMAYSVTYTFLEPVNIDIAMTARNVFRRMPKKKPPAVKTLRGTSKNRRTAVRIKI